MISAGKLALAALAAASIFAPIAAQAGEVGNREARQESRIYNGARDSQLTTGEYGRLQRQEGRLYDQRNWDLAHDGGHLSGRQYQQLNREENHLSNEIYRDRHNDRYPH
jgi:hypothetical protein